MPTLEKYLTVNFPDAFQSDVSGILCYGGKLDLHHLLSAYTNGIFPWPRSDFKEVLWYAPKNRGIIELKNFKTPTSLKKILKKNTFQVSYNLKFEDVILNCKKSHESKGEWITNELIEAYTILFHKGYAYSVECWNEKKLVGGLYGVIIGNFISAESMFFKKANASKVALISFLEHLNSIDSHTNNEHPKINWIDTQMITPVVESIGGIYITQKKFMENLREKDFEIQRCHFFPKTLKM